MDTLLRIVRFTNKTFALWVLLFGALGRAIYIYIHVVIGA